jgi:hypothetical protein
VEIETAALRRCFAARLAARPRSAAAAADATADAPPLSPDVLQQCVAVACGWASCVVGAGVYAPQLRAWRASYAPRSISVFSLNELRRAPADALRRIRAFLELPPPAPPPPAPPPPPPAPPQPGVGDDGGGGGARRRRGRSRAAVLADEEAAARANGGGCAAVVMRNAAAASVARARGAPAEAHAALTAFYAPHAKQLRRELTLLSAPLREWQLRERWLWMDEGNEGTTATAAAAGPPGPPPPAAPAAAAAAATAAAAAAAASAEAQAAAAAGGAASALPPWASLPSLFLLGGEKCGSTSLAFALGRHPQVRMARHALPGEPPFFRKELHFFDDDLRSAARNSRRDSSRNSGAIL